MRIAISGSRSFTDRSFVGDVVEDLIFRYDHSINVGDAPSGVDLFVRQWCASFQEEMGWSKWTVFRADWKHLGKRAGHVRNEAMLAQSDGLIAIFAPGPRTPGTSNALATATRLGIPRRWYVDGRWEQAA